jgi:hypothetical protein
MFFKIICLTSSISEIVQYIYIFSVRANKMLKYFILLKLLCKQDYIMKIPAFINKIKDNDTISLQVIC